MNHAPDALTQHYFDAYKGSFILEKDVNLKFRPKETVLSWLKRVTLDRVASHSLLPEQSLVAILRFAVAGRRVLEPVQSPEDAKERINFLSGRRHRLYSGLALSHSGLLYFRSSMTHVSFKRLTDVEKDHYIQQKFWNADFPGGYNPLGYEARWVKRVNGSCTNFIGTPLYEIDSLLKGVIRQGTAKE